MPERQSSPGETTEEGATGNATGSDGAAAPPPPAAAQPSENPAGSAGTEQPPPADSAAQDGAEPPANGVPVSGVAAQAGAEDAAGPDIPAATGAGAVSDGGTAAGTETVPDTPAAAPAAEVPAAEAAPAAGNEATVLVPIPTQPGAARPEPASRPVGPPAAETGAAKADSTAASATGTASTADRGPTSGSATTGAAAAAAPEGAETPSPAPARPVTEAPGTTEPTGEQGAGAAERRSPDSVPDSPTVATPAPGLSGWFTPRRTAQQPPSRPSSAEDTQVIRMPRGPAQAGPRAPQAARPPVPPAAHPPAAARNAQGPGQRTTPPAAAPSGSAKSTPAKGTPAAKSTPATTTPATTTPARSTPAQTTPAQTTAAQTTAAQTTAALAAQQATEQATVRLRADTTARFDPPTQRLPVQSHSAVATAPPPEAEEPAPAAGADAGRPQPAERGMSRKRRRLLLIGGVVGLLALLYLGDLVLSTGNVARGVTVAGLELGGLSKADARQRLQEALEPRAAIPITLTAGSVQTQLDPKAAGLEVDYTATIDKAGEQPLNPLTRITSFFTTREIGVVNSSDPRVVSTALEQLGPVVDTAPIEGTVEFEGTTPVPVQPVPGQRLDVQAAVAVVERDWAAGVPIALPMVTEPTITTPEDVQQAITDVAIPAVSAPLTVQGEGAVATVAPTEIAAALTFRADALASPKLVPEINVELLKQTLSPQLQATERPGRDATLDFSTGAPVITPSQDGRGVDYEKTFQQVMPILTGTGERTVVAVYGDQPAKITTEDIGKLGITGEISSFTTGGFAADSGLNIKRAAEQINGIVVKPGETFSLNAATNPRNAANGYVEAGIIEDGHPARGIGGGVSQVATTLYNAAYFAGMVDVAHKEHSFYISRYPAGREATVFDDVIDLKFRNDGPTAVLIQTRWTPSSLTVKMYGTKRYEVTSETGPRTNFTEPQTVNIPAGQACQASKGAQGFTVTDTRVMRNVQTGEVTRKTRTVRYNPSPIVVCGG